MANERMTADTSDAWESKCVEVRVYGTVWVPATLIRSKVSGDVIVLYDDGQHDVLSGNDFGTDTWVAQRTRDLWL